MAESKLPPLQHDVPIAFTEDGNPTPFFIQFLQQLREEKDAIAEQVELTAGLDLIAGAGLDGGGPLDGSAGDITIDANASAILDLLSTTRGTILYRGAALWSALAPGAAGQFLKTNGAGADPAWAAGGAGSLTLIEQYVADGTVGTKTFSAIPGTYKDLEFRYQGRTSNAASQLLNITVNSLGAGGYDLQRQYATGGVQSGDNSLAAALWPMVTFPGTGATAGFVSGGELELLNYAGTTFHKVMLARERQLNSNTTGAGYIIHSSGIARTTAAIASATFTLAAGNFVTGSTISLYGKG